MSLRYTPREAAGLALAEGPSEQSPLALAYPSESEAPERLHRRRDSREAVALAGPGNTEGTRRQSAPAAHLVFLGAVDANSTRLASHEPSRLKASHLGITGGVNGIFVRYVDYGAQPLRWIEAELTVATRLANAASQMFGHAYFFPALEGSISSSERSETSAPSQVCPAPSLQSEGTSSFHT